MQRQIVDRVADLFGYPMLVDGLQPSGMPPGHRLNLEVMDGRWSHLGIAELV